MSRLGLLLTMLRNISTAEINIDFGARPYGAARVVGHIGHANRSFSSVSEPQHGANSRRTSRGTASHCIGVGMRCLGLGMCLRLSLGVVDGLRCLRLSRCVCCLRSRRVRLLDLWISLPPELATCRLCFSD